MLLPLHIEEDAMAGLDPETQLMVRQLAREAITEIKAREPRSRSWRWLWTLRQIDFGKGPAGG